MNRQRISATIMSGAASPAASAIIRPAIGWAQALAGRPPTKLAVASRTIEFNDQAALGFGTLQDDGVHARSRRAMRSVREAFRQVALALAVALSSASIAHAQASSGVVYTADENGNTVSRIDLRSGSVDIVPVPVLPHNIQFVPGRSLVLVAGPSAKVESKGHSGARSGTHAHERADTGKLVLLGTVDITASPLAVIDVGAHPAHVVADAGGERAFVTNAEDDTITVVDIVNRKVISTIKIGDYPHGLRISPDGRSIYVANVQDGTVSVIDTRSLSEVARIEVGATPVQVGFTPDGNRVYVSLRDENKVAVIDTAKRAVIARIDVGRSPIQVYATPDGRFVYVANQGTATEPDDRVSVIDVAKGTVIKTIQTGAGAHGVVVSNDGAFVFVTNIVEGTVSEIAVSTQSVVRTHRVGTGPNGVTFGVSAQ